MSVVRVVSYNVRSLRDDQDALVRVIRGLRADVLCMQEAPRFLCWRRRRRRLAARCGLGIAVGRRAAGLAVLAEPRVRVVGGEYHLLTPMPGLHRRGLAIAVLEVGGARLIAASTHLDLMDEPRHQHAGEVLALLERARQAHSAPVVLTGDINERPGGQAWELLAAALPDAHRTRPHGTADTYSSDRPRRRIDGIFVDPAIEVLGCGVPVDPALAPDYPLATDHLPVLAELRLPG